MKTVYNNIPQFIYDPVKTDNDIVVIRLTSKINFYNTPVAPVRVAYYTPSVGTSCIVSGFGRTYFGNKAFQVQIQAFQAQIQAQIQAFQAQIQAFQAFLAQNSRFSCSKSSSSSSNSKAFRAQNQAF